MGKKVEILIDTNILIKLFRKNKTIEELLLKFNNKNIYVSDITVMELLIGCDTVDKRKTIENEIKGFGVSEIIPEIIDLAKSLIKRYAINNPGRVQLADMIIAASAVYEEIELLTHNKKDFEFIKELKLHPLSK